VTRKRLLLLLPTTTYRADAFVDAALALDIDLTVASEVDSSLRAANPSGLLTVDLARPTVAAAQVAEFADRYPVSAVVGVDDDTAVVAAVTSHLLGLPYNSTASVEAARDKYRQRVLMRDAGVPVPQFSLHSLDESPDRVAARVSYPCVLKPLVLSASRGVMRANDESEFRDSLARLARILDDPSLCAHGESARQYLVEAFVNGPEFAVEGLVIDGRLHVLAIFDKPDPLDGPFFEETIYVTPSRAAPEQQQALREATAAAAAAIGLSHGPLHAELRHNAGGPWIIELAARPIGGKCGRVLRFGPDGSSLEKLLLRHALGELGEVPLLAPGASGVMMIPTPQAGKLVKVGGTDDARSVEGVDDVVITAHRGQELVPLPEGSRYLGFIFARAEAPERVESAIRAAYSRLEIVLE
jgi:biotin carboxylase